MILLKLKLLPWIKKLFSLFCTTKISFFFLLVSKYCKSILLKLLIWKSFEKTILSSSILSEFFSRFNFFKKSSLFFLSPVIFKFAISSSFLKKLIIPILKGISLISKSMLNFVSFLSNSKLYLISSSFSPIWNFPEPSNNIFFS